VIRRISYDHPVYTTEGVAAQARHAEISGVRGTHFCGAYWGWGFHEDGVVSALRACEEIAAAASAAAGAGAVSDLTRQIRRLSSDTPSEEVAA
jgi:predicted NAD/FAD-binding protein